MLKLRAVSDTGVSSGLLQGLLRGHSIHPQPCLERDLLRRRSGTTGDPCPDLYHLYRESSTDTVPAASSPGRGLYAAGAAFVVQSCPLSSPGGDPDPIPQSL